MRLLEFDIYLFDSKNAEVMGDQPSTDSDCVKRRAFLDLDYVECVYEARVEGLVVCMRSGESFWLKHYKIDRFVELWRGSNLAGMYPVVGHGNCGKAVAGSDDFDVSEEIRKLTEL